MAAAPLDLSAGLTPAAPPPATPPPASGAIDLSAGLTPAAPVSAPQPAAAPASTPASLWQQLKDHVKSNIQANLADTSGGYLGDFSRGVFKGGLQTIGGATNLGARLADELGGNGDVADYQQRNPGATTKQAQDAVQGKGPNGTAVTPYRSAENQKRVADLHQTAKWFTDNADTHGFWEGMGSAGESVAELLSGEGLLKLTPELTDGTKVAGIADKLKATEKVATFLQNNPKIAKLMALGMRTAHAAATAGAQTAAQTYVKSGGDVTQTAEAAAMGAAGGGVIHAGVEGVGALVSHLAPEVKEIAGREVPILRSQMTGTAADGTPIHPSMLQDIAATTNDSPGVVGQQQAAAADSITQEARAVLSRELGAANDVRTAAAGGAGDPAAEAAAGGAAPTPNGAPVEERVWPRPGAAAEDTSAPGIASGETGLATTGGTPNAASLTDGETGLAVRPNVEPGSAGDLGDGRAPFQGSAEDTSAPGLPGGTPDQVGAGSPPQFKLQPINTKALLANTHDFGDAADHLHNAAKPVYDRLNEVTGGQWQAADQRIQSLQSKYWKAVGSERDAIAKDLQQANGQMDKLFRSPSTGVSPEDLGSAKRMYRSGYLLRDLHNALEPAYQIDADFARETGKYRGFNGSLALSRLRTQMRNNPDIKNLLGHQAVSNLQDIFHYNVTMAGRKRFGDALGGVARWIADHGGSSVGVVGAGLGAAVAGKEGAAAVGMGSEAAYQALKFTLHRVATDPQVGRNLMFAIEGGARPENYQQFVGRMILQGGRKYALPVAAGAIARSGGPTQPDTPENQ